MYLRARYPALGGCAVTGSVFLWFHGGQLRIPVRGVNGKPIWKIPGYSTVMRILSNPFYAGAYVFGRTRLRTRMVDGRGRKTKEFRPRHHQQFRNFAPALSPLLNE
jgi:hypothetical protein